MITLNGDTMVVSGDSAIGQGRTTKTGQTGGTLTLSAAENGTRIIEVSGTLTSNLNVVVETKEGGEWLVYNATSGDYTVTVKTSAGSGVVVAQGKRAHLICNGTDVVAAVSDAWLVGAIPQGRLAITMTDANYNLTYAESNQRWLVMSGTLTAGRNVVLKDNAVREILFENLTGQTLTLKTSAGSGIAVATVKRALLACDGTNVVRVTADI